MRDHSARAGLWLIIQLLASNVVQLINSGFSIKNNQWRIYLLWQVLLFVKENQLESVKGSCNG